MVKTTIQGTSGYDTQAFGTTWYYPIGGYLYGVATENWDKCRIHDTLTAKNLYVGVVENTLNNSTTVRSRKNAANGNLSVSIPTGTTGDFEDTVNNDALASGNDYNYQVVTGGTSGLIRFSYISTTIEHATEQTSILCTPWCAPYPPSTGATVYYVINGKQTSTLTESNTWFTIRFSCQLSRLNVYVSSNAVVNATTVRTRKNGANGAQSISIPGGATGYFENGANADNLVSGDTINLQVAVASGGKTGRIYIQKIQMRMKATASDTFLLLSGEAAGNLIGESNYYYNYICGMVYRQTVESNVKLKVRAIYINLQNFFVRIITNTSGTATTVKTRRNSADGNLSVSIPAGGTGAYEDTTHQDTILINEKINYYFSSSIPASSIQSVSATVTVAPPPAVETPMVSSSYYLLRRRV
jgi:hypothetical protein